MYDEVYHNNNLILYVGTSITVMIYFAKKLKILFDIIHMSYIMYIV